mmetsp:Transcript_6707/g.8324  ORF Transcript_6707/g.8324 Transcript_6707/m.8324 type:complete len:205 (+) Transcript_6707:96-710(+)|eukprot:CAMPEP_0172498194 /NCGR_PEP_ID=MMETSP1066-20121228/110612_1 /TAXON_ID=671091 /ORGANISM="Coscinodiscus wailesii, Strain CCMP2513" /LENGTH=204 /DNA_ID=CAMNT_0013271383 /DNA_START=89 /DNA_END=703 /DNA_ORIENTATION=+
MFKRFDPSSDCSTSTQVKASVQRNIKSQILSSHPNLSQSLIDNLVPKKPPLIQYKAGQHLLLYCRDSDSHNDDSSGGGGGGGGSGSNVPLFFQSRDGPLLPSLKLVHAYPDLGFTQVTVDKGAIPFVLGGANIMCPGLTNPGAVMEDGLEKGRGVVIMAEGKEFALAVGVMKMSSEDIRRKNKGIGVEVAHYLGDGLYQTNEIN